MELQGDAGEKRNANGAHAGLHIQENSCVNGHVDSRRRRPISVIGGVDLFVSPDEKEDAELPSVRIYF